MKPSGVRLTLDSELLLHLYELLVPTTDAAGKILVTYILQVLGLLGIKRLRHFGVIDIFVNFNASEVAILQKRRCERDRVILSRDNFAPPIIFRRAERNTATQRWPDPRYVMSPPAREPPRGTCVLPGASNGFLEKGKCLLRASEVREGFSLVWGSPSQKLD